MKRGQKLQHLSRSTRDAQHEIQIKGPRSKPAYQPPLFKAAARDGSCFSRFLRCDRKPSSIGPFGAACQNPLAGMEINGSGPNRPCKPQISRRNMNISPKASVPLPGGLPAFSAAPSLIGLFCWPAQSRPMSLACARAYVPTGFPLEPRDDRVACAASSRP